MKQLSVKVILIYAKLVVLRLLVWAIYRAVAAFWCMAGGFERLAWRLEGIQFHDR